MDMRWTLLPGLGALAALLACGGLEVPDLTAGSIAGRVANASASGGKVYVLGFPDRQATIADDGTYEVTQVPIGRRQLVVVSAAADGATRAELVPVEVRPGMRNQAPDRDAATMEYAGRILAAALPVYGCQASSARFTVEGTIYQRVGAGSVVLGDLPAGAWNLTTELAGFLPRTDTVVVSAGGDSPAEESLDLSPDAGERGCLSTGCLGGLHCNTADGRCYACLGDSDCQGGQSCDLGTHTCVASSSDVANCQSASTASQCVGGVLVPYSGGGGIGYCSLSCPGGQADCPSGWVCNQASADGPRCEVLQRCDYTSKAFGNDCYMSSYCTPYLFDGFCLRAPGAEKGYCTAPCTSDQSCAGAGLSGWTCSPGPGGTSLYCQPPAL